ncbi:MAG TPA: hypothetical protein QGG70_00405 [Candidatus Pacearchaeota archaeon]|jgi:hypothetical protein|nr:hypothetical protein [Candidatus Pacearchaeota archaeon]|tara:strand:+ start:33 stop:353 length:321 start_codon:yes stop_codon:yes gene_type:complete
MITKEYIQLKLIEAIEYTKYSNEDTWSFIITYPNGKKINHTGDVESVIGNKNEQNKIINLISSAIEGMGDLQITKSMFKKLANDFLHINLPDHANKCLHAIKINNL